MTTTCIYHGNCADGFTAAWAVRKAIGDADVRYFPGVYQEPPPDVTGQNVVMVDFSYKRPVLLEMAEKARSVLILDHHKTAAEDLAGFLTPPEWPVWLDVIGGQPSKNVRITALFDMERSGARIAWDYFHPGTEPPKTLLHVEDRDLWRFAIPGTREVQANIFSFPYQFPIWDRLMAADPATLRAEGEAIERKHFKDIDELLAVCRRRMVIGGHDVPVASLPYTLTSDAGHKMAQGEPFGVCYWDTAEARIFSLRSTDEGLDVSEIAKQYGGGGHRNAAGFRVPRDHALAMA